MSHCLCPPGQWGEEAGGQHGGDADQCGDQSPAEGRGTRDSSCLGRDRIPLPLEWAGGCAVTPKGSWCCGCHQTEGTVTFLLWVSPNSG